MLYKTLNIKDVRWDYSSKLKKDDWSQRCIAEFKLEINIIIIKKQNKCFVNIHIYNYQHAVPICENLAMESSGWSQWKTYVEPVLF